MKKTEQQKINDIVLDAMNEFNESNENFRDFKPLRYCKAVTYETDTYYILQSYYTIVAIIDKRTDTLYDFLRYVYGYTNTSAKHISIFEKDYCAGKWNCANSYRYYLV